jgi:hypothetical protein
MNFDWILDKILGLLDLSNWSPLWGLLAILILLLIIIGMVIL